MLIRRANENDFDIVYDLWKREVKNLGVPYKSVVTRVMKYDFYLLFDDDNFICMGGYHLSKKDNSYSILSIATVEEFRNQGYGTKLFLFLIDDILKNDTRLFGDIPIYLSANEDSLANILYCNYCDEVGYTEYKSCNTITYKVNIEKVKKEK